MSDLKDIESEPPCKRVKFEEQEDMRSQLIIENGLRKVIPYMFIYRTNAKARWHDRKLIDIMNAEMCPRSPDFFNKAIELGRLTVNGKTIAEDYVVRNGDKIENLVHRHESPVRDCRIEIISDSDDFLVINKPSSIPVHPCGAYNKNSILYQLKQQNGYTDLRASHRLDRLTSGSLIFSKNLEIDQKIKGWFREHKVGKVYLAKVDGLFPQKAECLGALAPLMPSMGLQMVSDDGKEAMTTFELVKHCIDEVSSIVRCFPKTGRTHQIRVHLQYLGFPIIDDPLYNTTIFGPNKGKGGDYGGKSIEQLHKDLKDEHAFSHWRNMNEPKNSLNRDEHCPDCKMTPIEPTPSDLIMHLHCHKLITPEDEFVTSIPDWAQ